MRQKQEFKTDRLCIRLVVANKKRKCGFCAHSALTLTGAKMNKQMLQE